MKISSGLFIPLMRTVRRDSAIWNANIANYEDIFKVDLNDDQYVGVNEDLILKADTDTIGSSFEDSVTGSLFIVDEGGSKADRKQVLDQGGWEPQLRKTCGKEDLTLQLWLLLRRPKPVDMCWRLGTKILLIITTAFLAVMGLRHYSWW